MSLQLYIKLCSRLNEEARKLIAELGSTSITNLGFRDNWVFCGGKGIKTKSPFEQVSLFLGSNLWLLLYSIPSLPSSKLLGSQVSSVLYSKNFALFTVNEKLNFQCLWQVRKHPSWTHNFPVRLYADTRFHEKWNLYQDFFYNVEVDFLFFNGIFSWPENLIFPLQEIKWRWITQVLGGSDVWTRVVIKITDCLNYASGFWFD